MAGAFVSLVLDAVHDVEPSVKLTLIALADAANSDSAGRAWPSVATLAIRTDRHERQIRMDLRELEAHHWIERLGTGQGGRGKATTYALRVDLMAAALDPRKAAAHYRVLRKIPGITLPPMPQLNPAVSSTKPGSEAPETRQSTAPEPELKAFEPEISEPARARTPAEVQQAIAQLAKIKTMRKKTDPEPEEKRERSRAEQMAWVADQLRKRKP